MFTGIIETLGEVVGIKEEASNIRFKIKSSISSELKVDQSVAHNGVCLTVVSTIENTHDVVAVQETLQKSNLTTVKIGHKVNLERCMVLNARLDGHIVQGHVDCKAKVKDIQNQNGSWQFDFELYEPSKLIVEKGSICINGVSLTAFNVSDSCFSVAIIPYTYEHTTFHQMTIDDSVNIEFDIIGKYVQRLHQSA
ncbi:MAG: riboflavin synthase [Bacteroidetes bacterium]|nr:MAG: riboflavin synthase [Bacteroidota bacterium]MBL1143579.1 riboflavin synthase [Bacteroidota bacterium]MCB0803245.1 riboflavin synthase [Flavobacteriales bacterium]NOG56381.1 riboflavin synthase [Bacteroidota bacterium]